MKKIILTLIIAIFCNCGNYIFSQTGNDSLLLSLRKVLFPFYEDATLVDISSLCTKEETNKGYTTYSRQPEFKSVSNILHSISFTEDISFIKGLESIEQEYIAYFRRDWEPIFKSHAGSCEVAKENLQILQSLEETLLSLRFAKMQLNSHERFEYYLNVQRRWYNSVNDSEKGYLAFEGFEGFSPYYLDLITNRIGGSPLINFDFIQPFLNDLAEPLVTYLENYYKEGLKVQKLEFEGYVFFRVLNSIDEIRNTALLDKLVDVLLTNEHIDKIEISRNVIAILRACWEI